MPSFSAKILALFLKLSGFKYLVALSFKYSKTKSKLNVARKYYKKFRVSEFQVKDHTVVTLQSRHLKTHQHILYFHGGAYVVKGSSMHWNMVDIFATKLNCKVTYIDYPLAPEHTYISTFEMVQEAFNQLVIQYPNDQFIFIGDSAGAGLALAFAQKLKAENYNVQAHKIVLFSPWLDLTMSNPAINQQERLDHILPLNALIEAGKKYAGGKDRSNYLLSPIHGKFDGLADTLVIYGTHELFYPDCKKLQHITSKYMNFTFEEFSAMQHDWVIFPIPEATQALNMAIDFIRKK